MPLAHRTSVITSVAIMIRYLRGSSKRREPVADSLRTLQDTRARLRSASSISLFESRIRDREISFLILNKLTRVSFTRMKIREKNSRELIGRVAGS